MPRHPLEPGLYHLTARGVRDERIFHDSEDGASYLTVVGDVCDPEDFICRGYSLMPTHVHLLVETRSGNLSDAMRRLQGVYARRFNKHHGYGGHLFRARFHSEHVDSEPYLLECIRYIALNPVRAGLCGRPEAWRWGSIAVILGRVPCPSFLDVAWTLGLFDRDPAVARRRLADFVAVAPEFARI
jgi:REP element-mobilizing transposase RayT